MIPLAQSSSGGSFLTLLIFVVPFGLLFVFMRNQQRRVRQQQALQRSAEVGDEVLTTAGFFGTIVDEDEDEGIVTVEIAPGTQVRMVRSGIARRLTEDDEAYDEDEDEDEAEGDGGAKHDDGPDENAQGPIRS
jgi:preprotein translocase subunit YajC